MALHPLQATPDHAENAFSFLLADGFTCSRRWVSGGVSFKDGWKLWYESPRVEFRIQYLDVELDVTFTRQGTTATYYQIDQSLFGRRSGFFGNMFGPEKLADVIDRVAADIRAHYGPILSGDSEAWSKIALMLSEPPKKRGIP